MISSGDREEAVANQPTGRLGAPDEIATAVRWLCSRAANFIIGVALPVDQLLDGLDHLPKLEHRSQRVHLDGELLDEDQVWPRCRG